MSVPSIARGTLRGAAALCAAVMLLLLFAAPNTYAMEPSKVEIPQDVLTGQPLVDTAGVVGGEHDRLLSVLEATRQKTGQNLNVVYVNSFAGASPSAWGSAFMEQQGAKRNDLLFAVAVKDRQYSVTVARNSSVGKAQQSNMKQAAEGALARGEWAQAAVNVASVLSTGVSTESERKNTTAVSSASSTSSAFGGGAVLLLLLGIGVGLFFWRKRTKRAQGSSLLAAAGRKIREVLPNTGPEGAQKRDEPSLETLRKQADSLLIAADDALKSSEQEIGFAQAAYGDDAVKPFQAAAQEARKHLAESFKLQQQLDDAIPDTPEQRRSWLEEILRRCTAAHETLEKQKKKFAALRELESRVPEALEKVAQGAQEAHTNLDRVRRTLAETRDRYDEAATASVSDNVEQARQRLEFVDMASHRARDLLAKEERSGAAMAVRAAEEGLYQANLLESAVSRAAQEIEQANAALPKAFAETEEDLAQAKALATHERASEMAGQIAAAQEVLVQVRRRMESGKYDPQALLERIESAHRELDDLLGEIRDRQSQVRRARSALEQTIVNARTHIASSQDYIDARRGSVGAQARTRLAEAQRNLDAALGQQKDDPVGALAYAQQALELAHQAEQLAKSDVDQFAPWSGNVVQGRGGGFGESFAGSMGGALLGGLLGGMLSGHQHHASSDQWGGGGFGGWGSGDSGGWIGDGGGFDGSNDWGGDSGSF